MEPTPESINSSFLASQSRLAVLQRLTLEFSGVRIEELPSERPGDFMKHVRLTFINAEQQQDFLRQMLDQQRQQPIQ